jgi:hypothetical protein
MADWMHIVTGQDAYKRFEKYCIVLVKMHTKV